MIRLSRLINLREQQSPQPTAADPQADARPSSEPEAGQGEEAGGIYDFTKDFRKYQDTVNKGKAEAKKQFLNGIKEKLVGKTIQANASRGYGQPKSDYTIHDIKDVKVDFYYKEDVVVVTDKNDKKYFLTPGVDIKLQGVEPTQPEAPAEPTPSEPEAPEGQPEQPGEPQEPEAAPEAPAPEEKPTTPTPSAAPSTPQQAPEAPTEEPEPEAEQPEEPTPEDQPPGKKPLPKKPVAEETGDDDEDEPKKPMSPNDANQAVGHFLYNGLGVKLDIRPYIKKAVADNNGESWHSVIVLEIPKNVLPELNPKDWELEYKTHARNSGGPGREYSYGYLDIEDVGRNWILTFRDNGGLDI
jgi:hypothetical protein